MVKIDLALNNFINPCGSRTTMNYSHRITDAAKI